MPEMNFLQDLLTLVGLSVVVVLTFHRANLPPIVGFLITGIVCGPFGFKLVGSVHEVEALAEIGVVLLLFTIGVEFSIQQLMRLWTFLLLGGGFQVLLTIAATMLLTRTLGVSWAVATFLGMLISLSSTAIVIRLLADHGEIDSPHGRAALSILIFQDLCIVPMVLLTPFLSGQGGDLTGIAWVMGKALLFVGAAIIAARYLVPWLLYQAVKTRKREVFLLTIVLLCLGTAWATAKVGLSLALGAFIAGIVISESEYSHQVLGEILPFREVFNSLFFVSIGMLFDVRTLLSSPFIFVEDLLAVIVVKASVVVVVTFLLGQSLRIAVMTGLSLAQIGEFSFVLSQIGLQVGLLDAHLNQLFLAVAIGTMAITPGLHALGPRLATWLEGRTLGRWLAGWASSISSNHHSGLQLEDHVIVVGYGVNGRNLARVLGYIRISYIVIEMNPEVVRVEGERGVPILFGDATRPEILQHASIEKARVLVIAISDAASTRRSAALARQLNPGVHIIVRSRYLQEMEPLFALGIQEVIPEEFETSIEIFTRVLHRYLVPRDIMEQCIQEVRQDGYEMFRSLYDTYRPAEGLQRFLSNVSLEVYRAELGCPLVGKALKDSGLREKTGTTVVAIQRPGGNVIVNPTSRTFIQAEDIVLILGRPEQLTAAATLFQKSPNSVGE
jgi:CPA2 family monovalent cation:H+ antiporter-2